MGLGACRKQDLVLLLKMNGPHGKKLRLYEYVLSFEEVSLHVKKGISIPKLMNSARKSSCTEGGVKKTTT